jgi:hypothetical protein
VLEGCALWLFKTGAALPGDDQLNTPITMVAIGVLQPALPIAVAPPGRLRLQRPAALQRARALQDVHIMGHFYSNYGHAI